MTTIIVRPATRADVPDLLGLIRDLAGYEREPTSVVATDDQLRAALFGPTPAVFALVAERDGRPAGAAVWFLTFSTWLGRHGIHLEDLYVRPEARGDGVGRALLVELARIAVERGYGRVEWDVLDWNVDAIAFYRRLGASPHEGWSAFRLTGEPLTRLAAAPPPAPRPGATRRTVR